jgi:hypothetical protein
MLFDWDLFSLLYFRILMVPDTTQTRLTRSEIRQKLREMPVSRQQVRLMQKAIAELRRENALLTYMLSIR